MHKLLFKKKYPVLAAHNRSGATKMKTISDELEMMKYDDAELHIIQHFDEVLKIESCGDPSSSSNTFRFEDMSEFTFEFEGQDESFFQIVRLCVALSDEMVNAKVEIVD